MAGAAFAIRRARIEDAERVAAFAALTFEDTFAADNTVEDMSAYLASAYSADLQRAELSDPDILTFLAEDGQTTAAFAMIRRDGPRPPCVSSPDAVELWRFYVDRPWHGRGLAPILMATAMEAARELGGRSIWLSVWERNARAIAFYTKCGFLDIGSKEFIVGTDRQTDRVLVLLLDPT